MNSTQNTQPITRREFADFVANLTDEQIMKLIPHLPELERLAREEK